MIITVYMRLTVEEIYDRLVNDDRILTKKGRITFTLGDIDIIVRQRDVVGNIMQEWVEGWLKKNGIEYALNDNTQMPPDFYLNPDNKMEDLMEIKAFNYKAGPGFDIADFRMYEQEIASKPWMLHVTYLVFGYEMTDEGVVTIKKVWKNKVWEMSRPMESGEKKTVTLAPAQAYGERRADLICSMPTVEIPNYDDLVVGQLIYLMNSDGYQRLARVLRVQDDGETVFDFNHPMAGCTLTFDLELVSREPVEEDEADA